MDIIDHEYKGNRQHKGNYGYFKLRENRFTGNLKYVDI